MADLTMCKGGKCRVKQRCYRYVAKPDDHWQSWFEKVPSIKPCPYRIRITISPEGFVIPEWKK